MRRAAIVLVLLVGCRKHTSPGGPITVTSTHVQEDEGAPTTEVVTDHGPVRGVLHGGTYAFRGIPYAAAPVGERRFRAPEDVAKWTAPRDARDFGACCTQMSGSSVVGAEDCLTLNVWRPRGKVSDAPVLVFLHGGGNIQGCSSLESLGQRVYEGNELAAREQAVVVTVNYRLGALGFMAHPAIGGGNWGLRDQLAALAWVKRNAAAFGGDPSRVLVFGESAGAEDTCALVASPRGKGLFSRALMESGMCVATPLGASQKQGDEVAKKLGCEDAACLRAKRAEEIVKAAPGSTLFEKGVKWGLTVDGDVLPEAPLAAIRAGTHNHVPFVVGDNSDETLLWVRDKPLGELAYKLRMHEILGKEKGEAALARYPASAYADAKSAFVAATTDAVFLCPARQIARALAKSQTEPVYRYLFAHQVQQRRNAEAAAPHGVELLFVFHHLRPGGYTPAPAEEELATTIGHAWRRFADSGAPPGWPRYDAGTDPYFVLDEKTAEAKGLHTEHCDFWDSLGLTP